MRKRFSIPRDCDSKSKANCCSHILYPPQTACNNGSGLFWIYFKEAWLAHQNLENYLAQMISQQKKVEAEPVFCNLMGKKVKGYRLACTTMENNKWNEIITTGIVNGQAVLVHLHTSKPLKKNKDLQPVFRQIISLEE